MKKRLLILMVTLTAVLQTAWAYDFSATAPSGQTLYFYISSNNTVNVVWPNSNATDIANIYDGYTEPTGNLVIPSSVTHNGTTYTVTGIGTAFANCEGLTSVTIPNTVIDIYQNAFRNCTALTSVTIPNSVTTIGQSAFSGCSGLTSVTIPNSVTTIGDYAFYGCSGLTSVTIPNSVTTIGTNAFYFVKNINYNGTATGSPWGALNVNGYVEGDFIYSDNTKTTLTAYIGSSSSVIIPNTVTTIGEWSFAYCMNLTSVTIPNSVITIEDYAFFNSEYITSIDIPNSVTTIGEYAFNLCHNLNSLTIGNSVTTIGRGAFASCYNLTSLTIPNSVTTIGNFAFSHCSGLTSITIPNSVTTIDSFAFYYCTALTSVTIPNSINAIKYASFCNSTGLTSINIPNSVTTIEASAFEDCTALTSVSIPSSVTSIGDSAFVGCSSLDSLNFNAINCGDFPNNELHPFYNCPITTLTIGDSVQRIPAYLAYSLSSVTTLNFNAVFCNDIYNHYIFTNCLISTINIGDGVRVIPDRFARDESNLTSLTIGNSVTTIGNDAFSGCTGLTSVTLPNSVDTIGAFAFCNTGLTSITIPENVKYIGAWSFGQGAPSTLLTSVIWNAKNATLGDRYGTTNSPFANCYNISTVTFGDSVRVIPGNLFPSVSENITPNVYYGRDIENWINIKRINSGNYGYGMFGYYGEGKYNLYINNQLVTNLDIPNTVDTIQAGTFYGCNSIQSITIPTQIEFMESNAFCCWNLNSVTWNAINCNVESYYLGECGSGNINSLVLGDSVQVIPNYAFMVFGITNVNLPNSLTSIGENAFEGCINLASITIPSQVTTIGNGAFAECTNLRSITMEPTVPPTIYTGTFYGVGTGVSVNVPCGTVEDYSSAPFWFNFSNIRQSSECFRTITVISLNTSQGTVLGGGSYEYGSTATIAAIPKTGYQFYQWNDGDVSNPRSLVVSSDSSFIATFSSITTDGGLVHDTLYVDRYIYDTIYTTVHDTVSNNIYDTVIITNYDTIINTVYDTIITTINDTVTITQYDTIINTVYDTIINTVYDTITVSETYYTLDVTSTNSAQGIGAGSGSYPSGCVVTIVGLPMEGYRFVSWNDGNTDNPRQITISENASYVANFSTVDIEEAPEVQNLSVYPNPTNGVVTISEYDVNKVEIYDGVGKKVREYTSQRILDLSDLSSGEYILRITLPQGVAVRRVVKR